MKQLPMHRLALGLALWRSRLENLAYNASR